MGNGKWGHLHTFRSLPQFEFTARDGLILFRAELFHVEHCSLVIGFRFQI